MSTVQCCFYRFKFKQERNLDFGCKQISLKCRDRLSSVKDTQNEQDALDSFSTTPTQIYKVNQPYI